MYKLKEIRLYSGIGTLVSFLLSFLFGALAPNPNIIMCFGPDEFCNNLDRSWRDYFEPGTARYLLAQIGEVMTNVFFVLIFICLVFFVVSWMMLVIKKRTN